MSLTSFIAKWLNRYCDFDQKWGAQCVDLMRQFIKDVTGKAPYSIPAATYAKQIFKNFPEAGTRDWIKIRNAPSNFPQQGDILFFDGLVPGVTGIAGHVGIVTKGDVNQFELFNQNYPTNSTCQLRRFGYRGVMGWIRSRK